MSKATFMVVHPDGTYQTRTTTRGRVYTGAIVGVESVADLVNRYQQAIDEQTTWDIGWHQMMVKKYREALAKGQRYVYRKAEYRSDIEAARAEASKRNAKDREAGFTPVWDVYLVHPVPEGTKKSEYADLAKSIAGQWAVPF